MLPTGKLVLAGLTVTVATGAGAGGGVALQHGLRLLPQRTLQFVPQRDRRLAPAPMSREPPRAARVLEGEVPRAPLRHSTGSLVHAGRDRGERHRLVEARAGGVHEPQARRLRARRGGGEQPDSRPRRRGVGTAVGPAHGGTARAHKAARADRRDARARERRRHRERLRAPDCAPVTDGAAVVILAAGDRARELCERPAWICGFEHRIDSASLGARDLTTSPSAAAAGKAAGSSRAQVAELHAPFTHQEIILRGALDLAADIRLNPSGGALAANPMFAAGLAIISYASAQGFTAGMEAQLQRLAAEEPKIYTNVVQVAAEVSELKQYRDAGNHLHFIVRKP